MTLRGPVYDKMKFIAQIVLPAVATLYLTLAALWDLPKPQEVAATIVAIDTFLGIVLQISSSNFQGDGEMMVIPDPTGKDKLTYHMQLEGDPEDLQHQDQVIFKVKKGSGVPKPVKPRRRKMDQEDGLTLVELIIAGAFVLALLAVLIAAGVINT